MGGNRIGRTAHRAWLYVRDVWWWHCAVQSRFLFPTSGVEDAVEAVWQAVCNERSLPQDWRTQVKNTLNANANLFQSTPSSPVRACCVRVVGLWWPWLTVGMCTDVVDSYRGRCCGNKGRAACSPAQSCDSRRAVDPRA